jgi:serine protease Do
MSIAQTCKTVSVRLFLINFILFLLCLLPCAADEEQDRIRAIEIGQRSVVSLRVYRNNRTKPSVGSGIVVRSDGFIITNDHVVDGAKVVKVGFPGGRQYTAKIWKQSPEHDLALIKVEATGLAVAHMGNSDRVKLGQTAIAIGDPLGFSSTVTVGTVGGLGREIRAAGVTYTGMIQTDAAINPGSSGGALINLDGQVIGINSLIYTGGAKNTQGLSFSIPINTALRVARQMVGQRPTTAGKPWIGINAANLGAQQAAAYRIPAKRGILVTGVIKGGPADAAGLMVGDAIVQANGKTVLTVNDFTAVVNSFKPGDTIALALWRQGKKMSLQVTLDVSSQ